MIDMTLLPEPWRSEFSPVCAESAGDSIGWRATLRIGDWLVRSSRRSEIRAAGGAVSTTARPERPHVYVVGRDVSVEELYPELWDEWSWAA